MPIAKIQINLKGEKRGVAYQMLYIVHTIEMKLLMPPSIRGNMGICTLR
jgi:hypothetical protein